MKIVSGLPRSGTNYTAVLLNHVGITATHESTGATEVDVSWYRMVKNIKSVDVFLVRNPLQVMSSLVTINQASWDLLTKPIGVVEEDIRFRAIETVIAWNHKILATRKPIIRVESLAHWTGLALLLRGLGYERRPTDNDVSVVDSIPKNINSRAHSIGKIKSAFNTKRGRQLLLQSTAIRRRLGYQVPGVPPDEKFEQRVARFGDHLMYYPESGKSPKGMQIRINGEGIPMRRLAMFYKTGKWPEKGLIYTPVCGEKWCVNPDHLELEDVGIRCRDLHKGRKRHEGKLKSEWRSKRGDC